MTAPEESGASAAASTPKVRQLTMPLRMNESPPHRFRRNDELISITRWSLNILHNPITMNSMTADSFDKQSFDLLPLLHSVSYAGTWGQKYLTVDEFVDKAADLGFEGVLLMAKRPHLSLLDYGAAARDHLRQRLESRRMRAVYVAGYTNFTADYEHREVPQIEYQIHCVTELARLAHDLGGNMVRVFTAYEHPACDYGAAWNLVVKALKESAQRAAEFGVVIGVHSHHDVSFGCEVQFDLSQGRHRTHDRT